MKTRHFIFLSFSTTGTGISGGDRIFIELSRHWSRKDRVDIYTTQEGLDMAKRLNLKGRYLNLMKVEKGGLPNSFILKYLYKIILGIKFGFTHNINSNQDNPRQIYLYSSSEFWMDVFPALILKLRNPGAMWIATWYQTAPKPWRGFREGERDKKYSINALVYWLVQLPMKPLIYAFSDYVLVNNENERKQFPSMDKKGKVIVLIGAVRLDDIDKWRKGNKSKRYLYDAVYQGRFHPQKGVVELIDIWKRVVALKPDAKLAMIGDGPLMDDVKLQIRKNKLQKNVKLFGTVFDGSKKYRIFSQSKLVLHPSYYDSGGMASAEAMAFGLPLVAFNLAAYKSYYPQGIIKAKNEAEFADIIVGLLNDEDRRKKLGKEVRTLIESRYSWDNRAEELYSQIT